MGTHQLWPASADRSAEAGPPTDNLTADLTGIRPASYVTTSFWAAVTQRRLRRLTEQQRAGADVPIDAVATLGNEICRAATAHGITAFVDGGRVLWLVSVDPSTNTWYVVTAAPDDDASARAAAQLQLLLPDATDAVEDVVPFRFWSLSSCGEPDWFSRKIGAAGWDEIACNYTPSARAALQQLVDMDGPPDLGRLVLLYGPPGTGKTTFIRALARSWRTWADAAYIVDPEKLFALPAYLLSVVTDRFSDEANSNGGPGRYRLLVVEDADELLLADAKERSGQALSRLLNLTDGLLGEGLRLVILITTNVDSVSLHPALSRAGRCLANVHVDAFEPGEAAAWLHDRGHTGGVLPSEATTVAELYERLTPSQVEREPEELVVGGYL
jgi:hypothetical protein